MSFNKKECPDLNRMCKELVSGNRRTLSKMITYVENGLEKSFEILELLYPHCKNAYFIGITGPPGAGKSTLVDQMITFIRGNMKKTVGVIAVDPSSPFTGGALLGDRIRMQNHFGDEGVFIRSLSSRGYRGGISFSTRLLTRLYDAYGFDYVIIETVGVGQSEVDVMELADTTCVVLVPESGDTIQTMKAGLLEIADIFLVNKSDREGAGAIAEELKQMIILENDIAQWKAPVLMTQAIKGTGIKEIFTRIKEHKKFFNESASFTKRKSLLKKREVIEIALAKLRLKLEKNANENKSLKNKLLSDKFNPFSLARELIDLIIM